MARLRTRALSFCSHLFAVSATAAAAQPLTFVHHEYASFPGAVAIVSGDFDRDGWLDIAQANAARDTVTILLRRDGGFVAAEDVLVGSKPVALTTGDFNRDGIPDLAVAK